MTKLTAQQKETLLAELDLHKTEFLALRDEIIHSMDAERQSLNLSLVAAGAGLSIIPLISGQTGYFIMLLLPFVFHVILWEMLSNIKSLSRVSSYLTTSLIPRVNAILDELGSERQGTTALGWEIHTASLSLSPGELILTSLTPTRHWMPILAIATLVISYALSVQNYGHVPSTLEIVLYAINLILLVWAAIQNLITVRSYAQKTRTLKLVALK